MAYRNYSTAVAHIVDQNGHGDFTTIASALTAAVSGDTIFIREGSFTENLSLKAGVNLVAFDANALTPNVTIVGKCAATFTGTCSISGIQLKTNSDFCLAITGSNATVVNLKNCNIIAEDNTAISFTSSSGSAELTIYDCIGKIRTTGIAIFAHSSSGTMSVYWSNFANSGSSTTANTISAGRLFFDWSQMQNPITSSGTAEFQGYWSSFNPDATNVTALTLGGSGTHIFNHCLMRSGTASAVSIGSTATIANCTVHSSNANTLTGAGTLKYALISFTSSSSGHNVTTETPLATLI